MANKKKLKLADEDGKKYKADKKKKNKESKSKKYKKDNESKNCKCAKLDPFEEALQEYNKIAPLEFYGELDPFEEALQEYDKITPFEFYSNKCKKFCNEICNEFCKEVPDSYPIDYSWYLPVGRSMLNGVKDVGIQTDPCCEENLFNPADPNSGTNPSCGGGEGPCVLMQSVGWCGPAPINIYNSPENGKIRTIKIDMRRLRGL